MRQAAPHSVFKWPADGGAAVLGGALQQDEFDVDTPWHHHDAHQVQFAMAGALEVEDAARRSLLPRHFAAWVPAGVPHRTSLHHVQSVSVMITPDLVPEAGTRVRIIAAPPLMREMMRNATRWRIGEPLDAAGAAFFTAFGLLCRDWIVDEAVLSVPTCADPNVRAAMEYTATHLRDGSIRGASEAACMSERTLRRRFRELGMTWEEYRRCRRLLKAVDLLDSTALPIGEIAVQIGYASQSAFSDALQQAVHMTPSAFRRRTS